LRSYEWHAGVRRGRYGVRNHGHCSAEISLCIVRLTGLWLDFGWTVAGKRGGHALPPLPSAE
jgi:hypothetical protein